MIGTGFHLIIWDNDIVISTDIITNTDPLWTLFHFLFCKFVVSNKLMSNPGDELLCFGSYGSTCNPVGQQSQFIKAQFDKVWQCENTSEVYKRTLTSTSSKKEHCFDWIGTEVHCLFKAIPERHNNCVTFCFSWDCLVCPRRFALAKYVSRTSKSILTRYFSEPAN